MINIAFNFVTILGVVLVVMAIGLAISPLTQHSIARSRIVQNLLLAPLYLIAGVILFFYGWRFDLVMQLSQIILVGLIVYWTIKDRSR